MFEPPAIPWDQLAFPSTAQALRDYLALHERGVDHCPPLAP